MAVDATTIFCTPSTSLKTMASAVLFDRQPFDRVALRVTDPDYLRLKAISFERVALPRTHFRVSGGNGTVLPLGRFVADSPLERTAVSGHADTQAMKPVA